MRLKQSGCITQSRTFPATSPPGQGLRLDVRLVSLSLLQYAHLPCGCSASTGRVVVVVVVGGGVYKERSHKVSNFADFIKSLAVPA
jgi:hypothetical protein